MIHLHRQRLFLTTLTTVLSTHLCKKGTQALSTLHFNKSATNVALTKQSFIVTETMVAEHLSTFVSLINKVKTFMTAAVDCSVQNKFLEMNKAHSFLSNAILSRFLFKNLIFANLLKLANNQSTNFLDEIIFLKQASRTKGYFYIGCKIVSNHLRVFKMLKKNAKRIKPTYNHTE